MDEMDPLSLASSVGDEDAHELARLSANTSYNSSSNEGSHQHDFQQRLPLNSTDSAYYVPESIDICDSTYDFASTLATPQSDVRSPIMKRKPVPDYPQRYLDVFAKTTIKIFKSNTKWLGIPNQ